MRALGGAAVLKAVSPDLIRKSAVGGVRFVSGPDEAAAAHDALLADVRRNRPEARIQGVLVEERLSGGVECVLGLLDPPGFGPVVMFCVGGLFVEALGDVSFRLVPLGGRDARAMIGELRGRHVLQPYADACCEPLVAAIPAFAGLSGCWREAEVNPLLLRADGAWVLDAVATQRQS